MGNAHAEHPSALLGTWHDNRATYTFRANGTVTMNKGYKVTERWDVNGNVLIWGSARYRLLSVTDHQIAYQDIEAGYVATMER
jgi:hypothetical protein